MPEEAIKVFAEEDPSIYGFAGAQDLGHEGMHFWPGDARAEAIEAARAASFPEQAPLNDVPARGSAEARRFEESLRFEGGWRDPVPAALPTVPEPEPEPEPEVVPVEILYQGPPAAVISLQRPFTADSRLIDSLSLRPFSMGDIMDIPTSDPLAPLLLLERLSGEDDQVIRALVPKDYERCVRALLKIAPRDFRQRLMLGI